MSDNPVDDGAIAARLEGYDWNDIKDWWGSKTTEATDAGYTPAQINDHLGLPDPDHFQDTLNATARVNAAFDPTQTEALQRAPQGAVTPLEAMSADRVSSYAGVPSPAPQMPADDAGSYQTPIDFNDPSTRGAYADALRSGVVQTPQDFAERHAGAFLGAAAAGQELGDSDHAAVVRAAGSLAQSLPTNEDLTDAAIAIAHSASVEVTPDTVKTVKNNLAEEWVQTNKPLMNLYQQANTDPAFQQQLLTPPAPPEPTPWQIAMSDPEATEMAEASKAMEPAVQAHLEGIYNDWVKWADEQKTAEDRLQGKPLKDWVNDPAVKQEGFNVAMSVANGPMEAVRGVVDAAIGRLGLKWISLTPEEASQAVQKMSPAQVDARAAELGPIHTEASRIAQLAPEDREAALAKLDVPETPEGEAPQIDRAQVEELIPSYDAAHGWYKLFSELLGDESGILQLYHGTGVQFASERGAPFGRFQMEKIGAGEGAQLYSHGLYFAQDEKVSEWYRQMDVKRKGVPLDEGSLYTVHVDVDPERHMLDWDRDLGDQHADIQKMVTKVPELREWAEKQIQNGGLTNTTPEQYLGAMTGEDLYKRLMREKGATQAQADAPQGPANRLASEALAAQGIKGMQYTAGSARGQNGVARILNHVIYDPSLVTITHRNGLPVPANTLFADLQGLMQMGANHVGNALNSIYSAVPSWRTPQQIINKSMYDASREAAQKSIITNAGRSEQSTAHFAQQLEQFQGLVTPHVKEFEQELAKGPAGNPMGTVIGQLIDYIENRSSGVTLANSKLLPLADAIRDVNDVMKTRLQDASNAGLIGEMEYRDNYFRHLWKDPRGPEWDAMWNPSSGKQGSGQSLQQRTLPTTADGIRAGFTPRITNPIDLSLYDLGQKSRYLTALQIIDEAKDAGHAYYAFTPKRPGDMPLTGVKSQIPIAPDVGTMKLYGADGFHQSFNNWLSNGMFSYPASASAYEKAMWIGNMSTGLKLVLPTFHARVAGLASVANGIGQALEELGRGQVGWSLLHSAEAATWLPRIMVDSVVGARGLSKFRSEASDPVIGWLRDAGLRFGPRQSVYKMGTESLPKTGMRGVATGEGLWNNATGFAREVGKALLKDFTSIAGDAATEAGGKRLGMLIPRAAYFPVKELGRAMQTISAPLFDHWIPWLKVGAGYRRMSSWIEANPLASEEAKWAKAREIVKDLDNRFGELNQDTLFIPRMAKQIANGTMISSGWNYGSYRGFLGALGIDIERGNLKWQPSVSTSTVGTVAGFMLFNGFEQYVRTGQLPWQTDTPWKDLINYRTGYRTKTGAPERGGVPSELKEVFDLWKVIATGIAGASGKSGTLVGGIGHGLSAFGEYALGKANPAFQFLYAVFLNHGQDLIGNKLWTPGGFGKFMKENFDPVFLDAFAKAQKNSGFGFWSALTGDREAPKSAEDFAAFLKTLEGVYDRDAKQQAARERRENANLANPDPNIAAPSAGRGGGSGGRGISGAPRSSNAYDYSGVNVGRGSSTGRGSGGSGSGGGGTIDNGIVGGPGYTVTGGIPNRIFNRRRSGGKRRR